MQPVALSREQINAATDLLGRAPGFVATISAMELVRKGAPGFELDACLAKTAAVNTLFATGLLAVTRMAVHLSDVMLREDLDRTSPSLVDCLSALPPTAKKPKQWHLTSFASKFAHFFICPDHFPILDSYAETMVLKHLGKGVSYKPGKRYGQFFERITLLRQQNGLNDVSEVSNRVLDGYLWIAGQYAAWRKEPAGPINAELRELFEEKNDPMVVKLLKTLRGSL
jgi:hypothetical protein